MRPIDPTTTSLAAGVTTSVVAAMDVSSLLELHAAMAEHGSSFLYAWSLDRAADIMAEVGLALFFFVFAFRNHIGISTMRTVVLVALACTLLPIIRMIYNLGLLLFTTDERFGSDPTYLLIYLIWFASIALFFWTLYRRLGARKPSASIS